MNSSIYLGLKSLGCMKKFKEINIFEYTIKGRYQQWKWTQWFWGLRWVDNHILCAMSRLSPIRYLLTKLLNLFDKCYFQYLPGKCCWIGWRLELCSPGPAFYWAWGKLLPDFGSCTSSEELEGLLLLKVDRSSSDQSERNVEKWKIRVMSKFKTEFTPSF